jgi:hypothetical protein
MDHGHRARCHACHGLYAMSRYKLVGRLRYVLADDAGEFVNWIQNLLVYIADSASEDVVKIRKQDQAVPSRFGILCADSTHCGDDIVRCARVATRDKLVRNLGKLRDPEPEQA